MDFIPTIFIIQSPMTLSSLPFSHVANISASSDKLNKIYSAIIGMEIVQYPVPIIVKTRNHIRACNFSGLGPCLNNIDIITY